MTTFSAPLRVGTVGTTAIGYTTQSQSATVLGTNATTALFSIPKPYEILEIYVDVNVAYTASTTMEIGIATTLDKFADALDVDAVGRVLGSSDASQLVNWSDTSTSGTEDIIATLTGAATGSGRVSIVYTTPIVVTP